VKLIGGSTIGIQARASANELIKNANPMAKAQQPWFSSN
jgi:hypothetical protein